MSSLTFERINGAYRIKTEDGWHIDVRPLSQLFRLVEVREDGSPVVGRYWCYESFEAAALAAMVWTVSEDTMPVGWVRFGGARN